TRGETHNAVFGHLSFSSLLSRLGLYRDSYVRDIIWQTHPRYWRIRTAADRMRFGVARRGFRIRRARRQSQLSFSTGIQILSAILVPAMAAAVLVTVLLVAETVLKEYVLPPLGLQLLDLHVTMQPGALATLFG